MKSINKSIIYISLSCLIALGCEQNSENTAIVKQMGTETSKVEDSTLDNILDTPNYLDFDKNIQQIIISNSKGKELFLTSGSHLIIPPNCFVDKSGNPIKGEVTIDFEEFLTPGSIIASSINMKYDSAGVQHDFESAGMFRINAHQNQQNVYIAHNKGIKVGLPTNDKSNGFNSYYSKGMGGDWDYLEDSKCIN